MKIVEKREKGVQTAKIKKELKKEKNKEEVRNTMIRGQLNSHFGIRK